jgi:hypothetical protein
MDAAEGGSHGRTTATARTTGTGTRTGTGTSTGANIGDQVEVAFAAT